MKIGIAGPVTLSLLDGIDSVREKLPQGYDHPPMSALVNSFLRRGHEIVLFTTSEGISQPRVTNGDRLTICIARNEPHAARDLFKSERKDLVHLMKEHPVDILNAHWSYEFAWAALDLGRPTLVTVRDHAWTILKYRFDPYRLMRLLMNFVVLRRASYLSTNSKYLYDLLGPNIRSKARVIPNFYATDLEKFRGPASTRGNYVVSVSNGFGRRKNIDGALRAFRLIRKSKPDIEYHLIGVDMGEGGLAFEYADQKGLSDGVKFLGKMSYSNVLEEVASALVFVHPSREESFGMSVLEAMVVGTPVVGGSRSGNVPDLLDHGNVGVLCNVDSPAEIASGVLRLLTDEQLRDNLARNAETYAKSKFSEETVIASYLNYYEDITRRKPA